MGGVIQNIVANRDDATIVAGVDKYNNNMTEFPVYENISDVKEEADVVIDFSNPSLLDSLLEYGKTTKTALVIATTGYDDCQKKKIADASKDCPVFFTYNYSWVSTFLLLLQRKQLHFWVMNLILKLLNSIITKKIDAPSGTALMLADAINEELDNRMKYEYDRHSKREKRTKNEIGMHSIRGGTIVGEHEIIFAGRDEIITLSHSARSKEVFAVGAVNAAVFMTGKEAGMYDMAELVK